MKILLIYLNFLICFSTLLEQIRKDVVDKTLSKLPKRESLDILKMFIEMSKAKKENSLNDVESAYFAYKWIGQNIEYDCAGNKFGNSTTLPAATYETGKGGDIGIAGLFNMICGFLNIESNTIFGLKKEITWNYTNLVEIKEYTWNYISIDNKYYLLDVTSGVGKCEFGRFYKGQTDDYFGIDPELSIRHRFPNDKKWQLLSNSITEEKFSSQTIVKGDFFKYFKSITPDIQTIKNQNSLKIKLTVKDPNIKKLYFFDSYEIQNEGPIISFDDTVVKVINGTCEYTVKPYGTGYAHISISDKSDDKKIKCGSITYECIYDKEN